jgi:hypothetical protein
LRGLSTAPNLADPDGTYVELVRLYDGLDDAAQAALSARLILILCNHIGDPAVLREAFALCRATGAAGSLAKE